MEGSGEDHGECNQTQEVLRLRVYTYYNIYKIISFVATVFYPSLDLLRPSPLLELRSVRGSTLLLLSFSLAQGLVSRQLPSKPVWYSFMSGLCGQFRGTQGPYPDGDIGTYKSVTGFRWRSFVLEFLPKVQRRRPRKLESTRHSFKDTDTDRVVCGRYETL